jgi:ribonucleotide reductase alpha subunit
MWTKAAASVPVCLIYRSTQTAFPLTFLQGHSPSTSNRGTPMSRLRRCCSGSLAASHSRMQVFLELRKNHGSEEHRARDLFYALWIPDMFMRRVEAEAQWSLFCPTEAPGLCVIRRASVPVHQLALTDFPRYDTHGEEFDRLYLKHVPLSSRSAACTHGQFSHPTSQWT